MLPKLIVLLKPTFYTIFNSWFVCMRGSLSRRSDMLQAIEPLRLAASRYNCSSGSSTIGRKIMNLVPCPITLSIFILPDIASTMRLQIFSPSPVPFVFRPWLSSNLPKYLNSLVKSLLLMPMPVSSISSRSRFLHRSRPVYICVSSGSGSLSTILALTVIWPLWVNLSAFDMRFIRTCLIRRWSL